MVTNKVTDKVADELMDLQVLKGLVGDDLSLQQEVLQMFCNTADDYCEELERAYASHCCDEVKAVAHKFRSSAQTMGAVGLGKLCEQLEIAGRDKSWDGVEACFPEVRRELKAVTAFVQNLLRVTACGAD